MALIMDVFLNKKQRAFFVATQKTKVFIGGRGTGKSSVNGYEVAANVIQMPRSKGLLLGASFGQISGNILPSMVQAWLRMGMIEHTRQQRGHFLVGKKPPSYWETPIAPPQSHEHCVYFSNGSVLQMMSMAIKDALRGPSYDWMVIDEAAQYKETRIKEEVFATVRGNEHVFGHIPRHHSKVMTSSMPWVESGFWLLKYEELALLYPNDYFYIEATSYDNIDVLGKQYFERLKQELPQHIFEREVLNLRPNKLPNGFYDQFDEQVHCYSAYQYKNIYGHSHPEADYDPLLPVEISFDFGALFTCCIVAQENGNTLRFINSFFASKEQNIKREQNSESLINNVVRQFALHYGQRQLGRIRLRGDRNGNNQQANSQYTFFEQIAAELKRYKFSVELMIPKRLDPAHELKHLFINKVLSETEPTLPLVRINKDTCKSLIMSIRSAPITPEYKKDKRLERRSDIPQDITTHFSDAFDYLLWSMYNDKIKSSNTTSQCVFI